MDLTLAATSYDPLGFAEVPHVGSLLVLGPTPSFTRKPEVDFCIHTSGL